ncbi:MAG: ferrous iron transport protein B [Bacteroidota bacterium]
MVEARTISVALLGNPNSGKTTLFNQLTGMSQKTGNFPGVTVEKKSGTLSLNDGTQLQLVDFPGTYSFYPTAADERVVLNVLTNPADPAYPDLVLYVADALQFEKHLLLLTQVRDLGIPTVLAINRIDLSENRNIQFDNHGLRQMLGIPVVEISSRFGANLEQLQTVLAEQLHQPTPHAKPPSGLYKLSADEAKTARQIGQQLDIDNPYRSLLVAHHAEHLKFLSNAERAQVQKIKLDNGFESLQLQVREVMHRYDKVLPQINRFLKIPKASNNTLTDRLDRVLTHRIAGPLVFFSIMFVVFQAIFAWAETPMDWIEAGFAWLGSVARAAMPEAWYTDLLVDGILAGLGGVLVFIPQIAILFLLITLLEEVGYMARAVFLFDRVMRVFGLNGRSIVALISGGACAIPAIMATRTISNWKERLITIMVTPFISCSARIPVYAVLVGFVVPSVTIWGILNAQGLVFMGLYLLGIVMALLAAWVFKLILKTEEPSYLMMELPEYAKPSWRNVFFTIWEKVKAFVLEAGKIILIVSIVLWFLASYGPSGAMEQAADQARAQADAQQLSPTETADLVASVQLENSFAGRLGKTIEPVIKPLGYDWKIGIALITSFAAREVFVGTMATIYSVGSVEDEATISTHLAQARHSDTGLPVFTMPAALSLLIFYVLAMQCMSTLAVVRRETNSWKWPVIQFVMMTLLAYFGSLLVYQWLS